MLIDWLSIKLPVSKELEAVVTQYQAGQDRILRIGGDGSLQWEMAAWETVKSDSHQIAFQATGSYIRIQGSPARIIGDGDNVFSSGASAALDLVGCWRRMVSFVSHHTGIVLPLDHTIYKITRVDVTENLFLGSLANVRQALKILRDCEGGRYRVDQKAGDTVYWSKQSRLRKGKAYAKGAEIAHKMVKASKAKISQPMREYSMDEIEKASGLLRLELTLAAQHWRERISVKWFEYTPEMLKQDWSDYFMRMIGNSEIEKPDDIYVNLSKLKEMDKPPLKSIHWVSRPVPISEGKVKAAYSLWCLIKSEGWQKARDITNKATWYRNLGYLHKVGLSDADISMGQVVQLRQKIIEAQPVRSWAELRSVYLMAA